jgi:hypothetical protein
MHISQSRIADPSMANPLEGTRSGWHSCPGVDTKITISVEMMSGFYYKDTRDKSVGR